MWVIGETADTADTAETVSGDGMVQSGSAVCRKCGHYFRLMIGSEDRFQIVFCEDCGHDDVAHGRIGDAAPVGVCRHCGGNLDREAKPRCRRCRSTEIEFRPDR